MSDDHDAADLAEHVADRLRAAGLTAHVWDRQGNVYVGVQRGGAEPRRALLWVVGTDRAVTARSVESFAGLCDAEGVGDGVVLAAGRVADEARATGRDAGVRVVGPDGFQSFLEERDVPALLPGWQPQVDAGSGMAGAGRPGSGGSGRNDGTDGDDSPGLVARLRGLGDRYGQVAGLAVVGLLLLVVLVLGAAILGVLPSGGAETMAFSANSTADGGTTDVLAAWDARSGTVVTVDADAGVGYPAPNGSKFVAVALRLSTFGNDEIPLAHSDFQLAVNGTRHGYQPLSGYEPLPQQRLTSDGTVNATLVYRVPANASAATLVVNPGIADERGIVFDRDTDVAFNVTVQDSG